MSSAPSLYNWSRIDLLIAVARIGDAVDVSAAVLPRDLLE
jgi:hypothetical protein